jgi:hypothetical protein
MMNVDIRYSIVDRTNAEVLNFEKSASTCSLLSTTISTSTSTRHCDTFLLTEIALAELAAFPTKETVNALELNPADYED